MSIIELNYQSPDQLKDDFVDAYLQIWNHPDNLKYLSFTGQLLTRDMVRGWVQGLNEHSDIRYHLQVIDGSIVGISVIRLNRLSGCELVGVGLRPEWKGQSLGSQLIELAIQVARDNRYQVLETVVYADNAVMMIATIKKGFQPVEVIPEKRYDGMNLVRLRKYL
jgi:RimJ/RimL family protein N-acetyltransferase